MLTGPSAAQIREAVASGVLSIQDIEKILAEAKTNAENEQLLSTLRAANYPADFISRLRVSESTFVDIEDRSVEELREIVSSGPRVNAMTKVVHRYLVTLQSGETKDLIITARKLKICMGTVVDTVIHLVTVGYPTAGGKRREVHPHVAEYGESFSMTCDFAHGGCKELMRTVLNDLDPNNETGLTEVELLRLLVRDENAKKIMEEYRFLRAGKQKRRKVGLNEWYCIFQVVEQDISAFETSLIMI